MSEAVQVAVVSGLFVAIPSVIATIMSNNKTTTLMNYRMNQLEKKQDKYNNVIARTYELEKQSRVLNEQMKVANHRIDDLEKGEHE